VAWGSIGALASVTAERLGWALEQVEEDRWTAAPLAGLDVAWDGGQREVAINDLVVVRDGPGQTVVSIRVDGVLYAHLAGDGVVVATALGSSGYSMAAGGPILAPGAEGMIVTPLASHGGCCPPLVAGSGSSVTLEIQMGYGGARTELDGQPARFSGHRLTVAHRPGYATLVTLAEEEPRLRGLRRRGLVADSPRALVRDMRSGT
jgi:NAD+ kinase